MARQVHEINYTTQELDKILEKAESLPFYIWHDEALKLYRFFPDEEKFRIWELYYLADELQNYEDIKAYEFATPIPAPSPFTLNINSLSDNQYILEGSKNNFLSFTFRTEDGDGGQIDESVDVYYTFNSSIGTKTASAIYNSGVTVKFNVDEYLNFGTNTITILVKGRSTGAIKTIVATYHVIRLELLSLFDISLPIELGNTINVPYTVIGDGTITVDFYIDGVITYSSIIDSLSSSQFPLGVSRVQTLASLEAGKHTLQIKARTRANNSDFYSNLLYFEFIVKGLNLTTTLISYVFPPDRDAVTSSGNLLLKGELYVVLKINWAFYSSNLTQATIQWRLLKGTVETTLATRVADVVNAEIGTPPEPLSFMPTESGYYLLQALVIDASSGNPMEDSDGIIIFGDYAISVILNTSGIKEASAEDGLVLKLSGLGRDNSEPDTTKQSWAYKFSNDITYSAQFYNMPFNNNAGYVDNAVVFNNGAYSIIKYKPLSSGTHGVNATKLLGATIEIDFESFDVDDNDTVLFEIKDSDTSTNNSFIITPSKAILTSSSGIEIVAQFKAEERVKLCFVIYPDNYINTIYRSKVILYINGVMSSVVNYQSNDEFSMGETTDRIDKDASPAVETLTQPAQTVEDFIENLPNVKGFIKIGDPEGKAGIKIYYLRTYNRIITTNLELNNFFIDSGNNIAQLVEKNNIYENGAISIDKLSSSITTVAITGSTELGSIELLINANGKQTVVNALEIKSPFDSSINMHCDYATFTNAGQSTLDKPIPSFHVKLDKDSRNICYDRDGNILPKNRWTFRAGNVPEKKFRLQANFMDSSNAHNGAFFRMINNIFPNVKVTENLEERHVLRIPSEEYAMTKYSTDMYEQYGPDASGNNWKFPYNIHMVPDSIPCIVIYRNKPGDNYTFLGLYVLMEEKKSNYANGMHSIYNGLDANGNPDPFGFKSNKSETRLWDNYKCNLIELLTSTDLETLFLGTTTYTASNMPSGYNASNAWQSKFELIYPDPDDLTSLEKNITWAKFKNEFLDIIASYVTLNPNLDNTDPTDPYRKNIYIITTENQNKFNACYYNSNKNLEGFSVNLYTVWDEDYNSLAIPAHKIKLDRWHFAAYYILVLRNCCSDSTARNMEITTYDGVTWLPKWWDVDMQCGLSQTNRCDLLPGSDRNSIIPGTNNVYSISGRVLDDNDHLLSSALWDLLENCPKFQEDVLTMENALYEAGWKYENMINILDNEFVNAWSQALYNESSISKYLNTNDLVSLLGDRTPHRHWFLKTSYDHWDGTHACGDYEHNYVMCRTLAPVNSSFKVIAGREAYLGWGTSVQKVSIGTHVTKGQEKVFTITQALLYNNPLHIYSPNNLEVIDLSGLSQYIAAELRVSDAYNPVTGTLLKKLIIGTPRYNNAISGYPNRYSITFNMNSSFDRIDEGAEVLTRLEELSIQGLTGWKSIDMSAMRNLTKFYAAGSSLTSFNPANSTQFQELELPTTITSMTMTNCNLTDSTGHCLIKWFKRQETEAGYELVTLDDIEITDTDGEVINVWDSLYKTCYVLTNGVYTPVEESLVVPEFEEGVYYLYVIATPEYIEKTTVPTTIHTIILDGMGSDKGALELITQWITNYSEAHPNETSYPLRLTYNNVNWLDMSLSTLKLIAKISTRNITGKIKIVGDIDSNDIVEIKAAFGDHVFDPIVTSGLSIDANGGFVLGAPSEFIAGSPHYTITGITFPTMNNTTDVIYLLGFLNNDTFSTSNIITAGDIWSYDNIVFLNSRTGEFWAIESNRENFKIAVLGINLTTSDNNSKEITIKQKSYPTALSLTVNTNNTSVEPQWSAFDLFYKIIYTGNTGLYVYIDANVIMGNTDNVGNIGNLLTWNWIIPDEFQNLENFSSDIPSSNHKRLQLYLQKCPPVPIEGVITYKEVYGPASDLNTHIKELSKSIKLYFKAPAVILRSYINSPLQSALYNNGSGGISTMPQVTYDTEAMNLTGTALNTLINFEGTALKPNNLAHLAELNSFININSLIVNNCTLLGSISDAIPLEDNTSHFVDVIPTRDLNLTIDLVNVDLRNTQVKGINLKENSSLESIYFSDYTNNVKLISQNNIETLDLSNVAEDCTIIIDSCANLETLNL